MRSDYDRAILETMKALGDGTERILAIMCMKADEGTFHQLRLTWPEVFKKYLEITQLEQIYSLDSYKWRTRQ
jgi:hypothetical protein